MAKRISVLQESLTVSVAILLRTTSPSFSWQPTPRTISQTANTSPRQDSKTSSICTTKFPKLKKTRTVNSSRTPRSKRTFSVREQWRQTSQSSLTTSSWSSTTNYTPLWCLNSSLTRRLLSSIWTHFRIMRSPVIWRSKRRRLIRGSSYSTHSLIIMMLIWRSITNTLKTWWMRGRILEIKVTPIRKQTRSRGK